MDIKNETKENFPPSSSVYTSKGAAIRRQFKSVWILPYVNCVVSRSWCESAVLREKQPPQIWRVGLGSKIPEGKSSAPSPVPWGGTGCGKGQVPGLPATETNIQTRLQGSSGMEHIGVRWGVGGEGLEWAVRTPFWRPEMDVISDFGASERRKPM